MLYTNYPVSSGIEGPSQGNIFVEVEPYYSAFDDCGQDIYSASGTPTFSALGNSST